MIQILSSIYANNCSDLHGLCFNKKWSINEFTNLFNNKLIIIFGYWDKDILLGILCMLITAPDAEIYTLCTHPNYRGKKIASKLIKSAKQECYNRLVTDIFLDVAVTNIDAIKCYEKNNFKIINNRKNYYTINNHYVDAFMMQAVLKNNPSEFQNDTYLA